MGRVGAGKTTLLTGLIGETKKTQAGVVRFGGNLAYGALFGDCCTASILLSDLADVQFLKPRGSRVGVSVKISASPQPEM